MTERINAAEARERTHQSLVDSRYDHYVAALDSAITDAADRGEVCIHPIDIMANVDGCGYVGANAVHAVRKRYEHRGFRWGKPVATTNSDPTATQGDIELSWEREESS